MSIALVVTRGYGNATFSVSIPDVVRRGYAVSGGVPQETRVSGGWSFWAGYDAETQRRQSDRRRREEREREAEAIEDEVAREIALLLRAQEAEDERRKELARLSELAQQAQDLEQATAYSERVGKAFERALRQSNYSALEALDREMQRAQEEEEFMLMAAVLILQ